MKIGIKPFIALMRRAVKSQYKTLFLSNRMLMQCYNIDHDSDVGLHYILPIPPTEEYQSEFYDLFIELSPKAILDTYNEGHKYLLEKKKEGALKPKDLSEELYASDQKNGTLELKFLYYAKGEVCCIKEYAVRYPVDPTNVDAENCANTYAAMWDRVKYGGKCVLIDCIRTGIIRRTMDTAEIYFHVIKMGGTHIRIPLMRSIFLNTSKWNRAILSIQETELDNVYLMGLELMKDDIIEVFSGYIQNW